MTRFQQRIFTGFQFIFFFSILLCGQKVLAQDEDDSDETVPEHLFENRNAFGVIDAGYSSFLSNNSPCLKALNLQLDYGVAILDGKAAVTLGVNGGFGIKGNENWLYNAFNKKPPFFTSTGRGGISYNICAGFMPFILNNRKVAVLAGPMVGLGYITMPQYATDSGGTYHFAGDPLFAVNYSLQISAFLGKRFFIKAGYANLIANTVTPVIQDVPQLPVKVNYSQLFFGIGFTFIKQPWPEDAFK
jgi:hypothetical protein